MPGRMPYLSELDLQIIIFATGSIFQIEVPTNEGLE